MSRTAAWVSAAIAFCIVVGVVIAAAFMYNSKTLIVETEPTVEPVEAPLVAVGSRSVSAMLPDDALKPLVAPIMDNAAKNKSLGDFHAAVFNGATSTQLWQTGANIPATPASSMKILTAAAVLLHLPHDKTVTTQVLRFGTSDDVYLVGAGDPTLSRDGDGFYTDAASIVELADQVADAVAGPVGTVYVDASLFSEIFHDSWDKAGLADGYVAPIESIAIDAGRSNAKVDVTTRSDKPALDAAQALKTAVGAKDAQVAQTSPEGQATVIAHVQSAPLETRVRDMMQHSDNVLAETLARELAIARGLPPTFAGAAKAVRDTLTEHGLWLDQPENAAVLVDSSGLSPDNRLTALQLGEVLNAAVTPLPTHDDGGELDLSAIPGGTTTLHLRPLLDSLPVAAVSGTLADRYSGGNPGAGYARAKTGTLDGVSALAGLVVTDGGELLTFVMLSNDAPLLAARATADETVGKLKQIR